MLIKFLTDEDFVNYKKCSMFIGFPCCTFKCDKENGCQVCQNMFLANTSNIEISAEKIFNRYIDNPLSKAIVLGGLEPFDSFDDVLELIKYFRRNNCDDVFIIYTGYTEDEIINNEKWETLLHIKNIIIKYGRFKPNQKEHFDYVLGVNLASDNQYAKQY